MIDESEYERLKAIVQALPRRDLTLEERVDWAYGNIVIDNPRITREMVEYIAIADGCLECAAIIRAEDERVPTVMCDCGCGQPRTKIAGSALALLHTKHGAL
jgi:hypothetical protein